jgi:multidrug efflux pump
VWNALSRNNYSPPGATKGSMTSVNLVANTDLKTVDDFKRLVVKQDGHDIVRLGDLADVVLGAEDYNTEVRFDRPDGDVHGRSGCCPARTRSMSSGACASR